MSSEIGVLHVDDDPSITDLTATFLERENDQFSIQAATSANEGLNVINDSPPDCVVSDYNMPGLDGLEFLQTVREEYPDLPFILFTGKGSEAVASDAIAADVTDYLQKGSGTEQYQLLANRIRNAVQARREVERADRQKELIRLTEITGGTGGFEVDIASETILLTEGTRRIINRPEQAEISLEDGIALFHPNDRAAIQHALGTAIETGEQTQARWRLQPDDGDERLLDLTITPVVENGDVTKVRGAGHDITDRKERRRKLAQTHDLMSNMEQLADAGAWEYDSETETTVMTDGTRRIHGLDPGADLTLVEAFESFHPDDRDLLEDRFDICLETGEPYEEDVRLTTPDGEQRWITTRGERVNDGESGEVVRGYLQDITEQKQRERDRRQERDLEAELSEVLGRISDAFFALDAEFRVTHVNGRAQKLLEASEDELLGETLWDMYPETEESDKMWDSLRAAIDTQTPQSLELCYEPRGDWFEATVYPSESGVSVYCQDVTKRKNRKQELQELKSQYQSLAENFPGGAVYLINTDLKFVRARGEELTRVGLSPNDFKGKKPHALFPEEIADELCHYVEEALDGNANTFEQEYEGDRYRLQTVPVRNDDEEVGHVMGVSQNITEYTENKQNLERQNERLAEFASIVSHDLRSPLGVAEGHLELAEETSESEHLTKASDAIERSQELIDDLLTLAREGDEVDETEPVRLAEVAESSWQTVETRQATLDAGGPGVIEADRSRLQQLFENLYRNAIEHGGDDVTVSVGEMPNGFYVADTGPGIPESEREELFKTGYSATADGTRFGLRIVEQIAKAQAWESTVTDSEQGGARFEFTGVEVVD